MNVYTTLHKRTSFTYLGFQRWIGKTRRNYFFELVHPHVCMHPGIMPTLHVNSAYITETSPV